MKHIHQIDTKHLAYLVLNKRKLNNKQAPLNLQYRMAFPQTTCHSMEPIF